MIKGYRPSGYFETYDDRGRKITGECRQCSHCQYTWIYKPDKFLDTLLPKKRRQRGICLHCMGLLCGKPACMKSCAPFSELASNEDKHFELTDNGIYVKVT